MEADLQWFITLTFIVYVLGTIGIVALFGGVLLMVFMAFHLIFGTAKYSKEEFVKIMIWTIAAPVILIFSQVVIFFLANYFAAKQALESL